MPDTQCHLAMARRNQEVIQQFLDGGNRHPEWLAVVAFYKALHVVDAVLFADNPARHGGSHHNREHILKTTARYQHIFKHYRPLYAASLVGRYLEFNHNQFTCFADYMAPDFVVNTLLSHHLRQVERSAEMIIGPLGAKEPTTP